MAKPGAPNRTAFSHIIQMGLGLMQAAMGLVGAGSVFFVAHNLFLRYYAREWGAIQFSGVNGCAGEETIVNGDLIGGQTLCNQPLNFVPWVVVYQHHWKVAAAFYGAILAVIFLIGLAWSFRNRPRGTPAPFGRTAISDDLADHEHLR